MPFPYPGSATAARPRRLRDREKDIRYRSNSTSSRRPKDLSQSAEMKANLNQSQAAQPSLYAQENVNLDRLPPLPLSRTTSSSSVTSPVLHAGQITMKSTEGPHQPYQFHTPASLRPYLEDDTDSNDCLDPPLPGVKRHDQTSKRPQQALDPWSTSEKEKDSKSTAHPVSVISSSLPVIPPLTPQTALPAYPSTSTEPFPTVPPESNSGYSVNPSGLIPSLPWHAVYHNEHLFATQYAPSRHLPMVPFGSHTGDLHTAPAQLVPYFPAHGYLATMPASTDRTSLPAHYRQREDFSTHDTITSFGSDNEATRAERATHINVPEQDSQSVLHRIQRAIPDLYLLMDRYQETFAQLQSRENIIGQIELQRSEAVKQKEAYIERLVTGLDYESQKHIKERSSLQLEIEMLEKTLKESQESLVATIESRKEMEAASEKRKIRAQKESGLKEQAMREDLQARTRAEAASRKELSEMRVRHMEHVEGIENRCQRETRRVEASHMEERQELKVALATCQHALDFATQHAREKQEKWNGERKELLQSWDEQRLSLLSKHKREMEVAQRNTASSQQESRKIVDEETYTLQRQMENLRFGWDADRVKLAQAKDELTALIVKVDPGYERLPQAVDASGESTKVRSKGDNYFIDAFGQLRKQITRLAVDCCKGGMVDGLPDQVLKSIPSNLPDFCSDSRASLRLRASYIQHIISRAIHQKIFQPFLFTLVCHHKVTNQFLGDMSNHRQHKSIRRESSWRQQTLHAAYTVRTAKQAVNKVAEDGIRDIMSEIRYFVHETENGTVQDALKRILKIATETWRSARLEKELFIACMSPEIHPAMRETEQPLKEGSTIPKRSARVSQHVLATFPLIRRGPKERSSDPHLTGNSCILSPGFALYADSPVILDRLAEIQQGAGRATRPLAVAPGVHLQPLPLLIPGKTCLAVRAEAAVPAADGGFTKLECSERGTPTVAGARGTGRDSSRYRDSMDGHTSPSEASSSRTTIYRPSLSSLSDGRSLSTATSPLDVVPDWVESSTMIPFTSDGR